MDQGCSKSVSPDLRTTAESASDGGPETIRAIRVGEATPVMPLRTAAPRPYRRTRIGIDGEQSVRPRIARSTPALALRAHASPLLAQLVRASAAPSVVPPKPATRQTVSTGLTPTAPSPQESLRAVASRATTDVLDVPIVPRADLLAAPVITVAGRPSFFGKHLRAVRRMRDKHIGPILWAVVVVGLATAFALGHLIGSRHAGASRHTNTHAATVLELD